MVTQQILTLYSQTQITTAFDKTGITNWNISIGLVLFRPDTEESFISWASFRTELSYIEQYLNTGKENMEIQTPDNKLAIRHDPGT